MRDPLIIIQPHLSFFFPSLSSPGFGLLGVLPLFFFLFFPFLSWVRSSLFFPFFFFLSSPGFGLPYSSFFFSFRLLGEVFFLFFSFFLSSLRFSLPCSSFFSFFLLLGSVSPVFFLFFLLLLLSLGSVIWVFFFHWVRVI